MALTLSIVIIEYYCMEHVQACVRSVREHLDRIRPEFVILSNSQYTDKELQEFRGKLGDVTLVRAHDNLGYAGGVNAALKEATGEYVYILNPDCLLTDGNIIPIIEQMGRDPTWAIAGPKVVDETGDVQPSCRRFPRPWTFLLVRSVFSRLPGAARERQRYLMGDYDRKSPRDVDWVSGGATVVKTAALSRIGKMDERYFLYMEDVDWCRAAWTNGFRVVYCPSSTVIHAGQHQSIKGGLRSLANSHLRWHISSLFKYFSKYRWHVKPDSNFYRSTMEQS